MQTKSSYRLSKYNMVFDYDKCTYIWNTVTGALIKMDDEAMDYIKSFSGTDDNSEYFRILKTNGFVVKSEFDETRRLLADEKAAMTNEHPQHVHYTIAPGLGCNYNCVYCFEKERTSNRSMTYQMQEAVCDYIIKTAEANNDLKHIAITWFGGEPLLYTDAIKRMSERLIEYCTDRAILYSAGIVTNGRFLTVQTAEMLKTCKVEYIQLAVDGMREYYSAQKGAEHHDFDAVIHNIKNCADLIPITVRINVDNDMTEALLLTEYLMNNCQLDGRIKIYIAHVRDYAGRTFDEEAAAHKDFLKKEADYISLFRTAEKYQLSSLFFTAPKRRCTTCPSVCATNYCIGPEGELYRCEHFFGLDEHIVGNINKPINNSTNNPYLNHIHPKKCLDCQIFPICLGGCMNDVESDKVSIACDDFIQRQIDYLMLSMKIIKTKTPNCPIGIGEKGDK